MPYLYLIITVFMAAASTVFGKLFHKGNADIRTGSHLYTFVLILSALIVWSAAYAFDFSFDTGVLLYSLLFALFFVTGNLGMICALQRGPTMLTSLFVGLSLLLPAVWGFFFWDSPVTVPIVIGLILVAICILLCVYSKEKKKKTLSTGWFFFITLAVLGNAGCTVVQRQEQMDFDGTQGTMLMFFSMLLAALIYLPIYLKSDRTESIRVLKRTWWAPTLAGVCNALLNLFVILLSRTELSPSLIYPVMSVGKLVVVLLFSLYAFKEKMRWWQWAGVGVGAIAIALLSL